MDGDGNFDIRTLKGTKRLSLRAIRIKLSVRDIKILRRIQEKLHYGRIRFDKTGNHAIFIISKKENFLDFIFRINGLIRLKVVALKNVCEILNIVFKEANYIIKPLDPYFAGLIDTDGSIVFNFVSNRIECNLELKHNDYSSKLNLDLVVPNYKPSVYLRKNKNQSKGKIFNSIAFKYQTVEGMVFLYEYFMKNRLYSDMKFYRICQIKRFLLIRQFKSSNPESHEYKVYVKFLKNWIKYKNPL